MCDGRPSSWAMLEHEVSDGNRGERRLELGLTISGKLLLGPICTGATSEFISYTDGVSFVLYIQGLQAIYMVSALCFTYSTGT